MEKSNPYQPIAESGAEPPPPERGSLLRSLIAGATWSVVSSIPITALMALLFRFPVPFSGIEGGPSQVIPAMFALFFYGVLMGGFILLGICGALAGLMAWIVSPSVQERRRVQRVLSIGVTFVLLFILATLDWYIGQW